jgi:hypothetical protein
MRRNEQLVDRVDGLEEMRRRYLNSTENIVSPVTNNPNPRTYPTFQL